MINEEKMSLLRQKLLDRRNEILVVHRGLHVERTPLRAPEPEPEERGQNDNMARVIDRLDLQEKEEIETITQALKRIEEKTYGIWQACGRDIRIERLEAVPWTSLCDTCGKKIEKAKNHPFQESEAQPGERPPDFTGMSDDDIVKSLYETLRADYRVETEELDIEHRHRVLSLQGFMPSEGRRQALLQILQDTLGFQDIDDRIAIDPLLWERTDRTPGNRYLNEDRMKSILVAAGKRNADVSHLSDVSGMDGSDDMPEEKPMTPPDELIPEDRQ